MAIYLKYPNIEGIVGTQGFEKQIELTSFRFGTGRSFGTAARVTDPTKRTHSEPTLSEIMVTKQVDDVTDKLFKESLVGEAKNSVTITFTKSASGSNAVETIMSFDLENCTITSWTLNSESSDDTPTETITLTFSKVTNNITNTSSHSGFDLPSMAAT